MATADQQGIMALPQDAAGQQPSAPPAQPQMGLDESYDAVKQGLTNASPQASQQLNQMLSQITPELDQLDDDQLNMLLQLVQYLHDHPEEYGQRIKELVDQGIMDEGDFPPEFDPEFLAALGTVLLHALQARQGGAQAAPEMTPPATMARGGIAEAARQVAGKGRGQDTMLAHITPREAAILRSHGGMGTINPQTGLPEYGLFSFIKDTLTGVKNTLKGAFKAVTNTVKQVLSNPIGKILGTVALATFLGPGAFGISGLNLGLGASLGLASAGTTLLGGGSMKQALISGATAYFGAPGGAVSNFVGQAGITNLAANAAASAGIVGVGAGLLSGQKLSDAVKNGLTAGATSGLLTGMTQGFGTSIPKAEAPSVPTNLQDAANAPTSVGVETAPAPAGSVQGTDLPSLGSPTAPPTAPTDFSKMVPTAQSMEGASAAAPAPDSSGIGSIWDKAKGVYNEYLSPSGIQKQGMDAAKAEALRSYNLDIANGVPKDIAAVGYTEAVKAGAPGMFATYGPLVGAGLGVTALAGGFNQKPAQATATQSDINARLAAEKARVAANPGAYAPQGMERFGITYNDRGEITGSNPWTPQATGPTEVAGNYTAYTPSPYMTPTGSIGGGRAIAQPYNSPGIYNFMPRYAADGGVMSTIAPPQSPLMQDSMGGIASLATGGYPRRTGPISGPGTETSDSIPAMLSDGEFVMTAKAVRGAGKGSRLAGAKKMYALMHQLERNAARG